MSYKLGHEEGLPVGLDLEYLDEVVRGAGCQASAVVVYLGIVLNSDGGVEAFDRGEATIYHNVPVAGLDFGVK
jgi:hypothetical protein